MNMPRNNPVVKNLKRWTSYENAAGQVEQYQNVDQQLLRKTFRTDAISDSQNALNHFLNPYNIDDIPIFTLWTAEWMLRDPIVKFGLDVRDGAMMNVEVEVTSESEAESRFVSMIWDHLWYNFSDIFMQAKHYGRIPGEVTFKRVSEGEFRNAIVPDQLRAIHPRNVRVILVNGQPGAIRLQAINTQKLAGNIIPMPMAFWITHDMKFSNWYGRSILQGSYQPFYERWTPGGAVDCIRKRTYRDAYNGEIHYVPERNVTLPDGRIISWRDMAEAVIEARQAGSSMVMSKQFDDNGNELTGYVPPQDTGDGDLVFRNYERNQKEIWFGLGVFEEVIKAGDKGSFSGRSVPLLMFLGSVGKEIREIVRCVDRDIIRPAVHLWKGSEPGYTMQAKSLVETLTQDIKQPVIGESSEQVSRFSEGEGYRSPESLRHKFKTTVGPYGIQYHNDGKFVPSQATLDVVTNRMNGSLNGA
jgi:hypothetical protein